MTALLPRILAAMTLILLSTSLQSAYGKAPGEAIGAIGLRNLEFDGAWTVRYADCPLIEAGYGFISAPRAGVDLREWRSQLDSYRRAVRSGSGNRVARMSFDGVRSWARLTNTVSLIYRPRPGERFHVTVRARWIEGNNELCFAFDRLSPANVQTGWSGVIGTMPVPKDGEWHDLKTTVTVPELRSADEWLKPILGMDATHNPALGKLEISDVSYAVDDPVRMKAVSHQIRQTSDHRLSLGIYGREDMKWLQDAYTCHFTFMYDSSFYDAEKGEYKLDSLLKDGAREFGGYDILLLWQGYPRLGVEERNQFDMYRDMPGGLEGIRRLVDRCHERGVKVFIDYNPWDTGTRREPGSDEDALVTLVKAIDCDGIFLDTMLGTSPKFREEMDKSRPGVAFAPEGYPSIEQLSVSPSSWGQYPFVYGKLSDHLDYRGAPPLLHHKWIEPRHMIHQVSRWAPGHWDEIETAFFNGSGMVVWENVFGAHNPWRADDRSTWRRCVPILKRYSSIFNTDNLEAYVPMKVAGLYANRWWGDGVELFTMVNRSGAPLVNQPMMELPRRSGRAYYDLWNGVRLKPEISSGKVVLSGSVDRIGCILVVDRPAGSDRSDMSDASDKPDMPITQFLAQMRSLSSQPARTDYRSHTGSVVYPDPVARTALAARGQAPAGMVLVPGADVTMNLEHTRRECGCYPDPGTPAERLDYFLKGGDFLGKVRHSIGPTKVKSFLIDEAEVTNAQFKAFLDATGYKPAHPESFLKHWPDGRMPAEVAECPVVYIDIDDARAYAKWAGKRLPTEEEWHLAAQGTDGRAWPWGDRFDPAKCNTTGRIAPVKSYPEGRSPYGCYNMSGNVWELTESCRSDGHTRFLMLRGGSFMNVTGSIWYIEGGPRPCTSHTKLIRMCPGLDRCSTIGFRCVKDVSLD